MDPNEKLGTRHHTVPKFHLARFANSRGQVFTRDRTTGGGSTRRIADLAVKDFYTFVNKNGHLDSSVEQLFSVLEHAAAEVLRRHLDTNLDPKPFTDDERQQVDTFVALQMARGARQRRILEILTDYSAKVLNQHILSAEELSTTEFAPHQNDHISMIPQMVEEATQRLADRPVTIVVLDEPWLVTCDEPVLLAGGLGQAERVIVALSPTVALVYGPRETRASHFRQTLEDDDSVQLGDDVLQLTLHLALDWVAAHPAHTIFRNMAMPPPTPLLRISDEGSVMSQQLRDPGHRRRPRRMPPSNPSS